VAVVFTPGMQGSASTWAYNVCRELLLLQYETVSVFYCDSTATLSEELAHVEHAAVIKMHQPDEGIIAAIANEQVPAVITVRDPRDSVVSLMERFNYPFQRSLDIVLASVTQILRIPPQVSLFLRYENGFFNDAANITAIANLLGMSISADQRQGIFDKYTQDSVKAFMDQFEALPENRKVLKNGSHWDSVTMLHKTHMSDGAVGKWKERLSPAQRDALSVFTPALQALNYEVCE
jgi:hypothetical protein